mgnify:CR=1 FL=1|jgi:hypothetical protein
MLKKQNLILFNMKKNLLFLMLFCCFIGFSQDSNYKIIKLGKKYPKELIDKAFSTADLCGSYLLSKNNDIVFDDGLVVRLFPKTLLNKSNFNNNCFVSDSTDFSHINWSISSNAIIVKGYQARPNKAYTK